MIKEVEVHESRSHWKTMKNSEVNNRHKKGEDQIYLYLVFQAQGIIIWKVNKTQSQTILKWRNLTMWSQLLGNLLSNSELD